MCNIIYYIHYIHILFINASFLELCMLCLWILIEYNVNTQNFEILNGLMAILLLKCIYINLLYEFKLSITSLIMIKIHIITKDLSTGSFNFI